ncbi:hypothetical protein LOD99_1075 [Oopsacas minuta]|uniref:PEHE domain-containing protein n=1 Tax=Oopsacas minuta TaxID=111878 RepID=A0AAV7K0J3_9METZ|nr:hypothetical protein LOD99_1075 [Oopsacas minuta]
MSVTSSPEPMELETGHPPSLLPEDVTGEWPIEEDPDIILGQFSYSRDQTRAKILSLTSEDQLTIGENIRPHPAHSDEVLITQTISIKSQAPVSLPTNNPHIPLLTSPRRAFSSLSSQQHKDTPPYAEPMDKVKINSFYKNTSFLNSNTDPSQLHGDPDCEKNSDISPTGSNTSINNNTGELESERVRKLELDTPADTSRHTVCRHVPSPVITNGTQHDVGSDASSQLKDSIKPHSLDTPPLSSTTPEDPTSDPFSTLSSDTQTNGLASQCTNQLPEKEGETESESNQEVSSGEICLKQSQAEIENKNPNYELETPPDDVTDLQLPNPSTQNDVQPEVCSSPCEFHDCQQEPATADISPSHSPSQPPLELDIEYSTTGEVTLVSEIETFSTIQPHSQLDGVTIGETSIFPSLHIPPALQVFIDDPRQDVTTKLHMKKYEYIFSMQQTLLRKSRELKESIAQMEEKILFQQSQTLLSVTQNKQQFYCSKVPPLTHSHLLKLTHTRESEKQARLLKSGIKNCHDRMNTGYETESSSEDECYLNSTNLGGPKRRRLTRLYRNWLNDRAEIGGRWNWLDLQIAQIDNEIDYVNKRLEDLHNVHSTQEEVLPLDTASRCIPYAPSKPSHVIHQSASLKLSSLNNILQSTPHHHSILSLRDDIPSTLLMYDSTMGVPSKDLPLDSKDLRKLELAISHNKSSPAVQSRYKAMRMESKKIGHRPKLNNSQTSSSKYRHVSIAEMSQNKPEKSKPLFHGGSRQRRARSYDTTSIIIPGSYLPKPEKPSFKEIIIPGWRPVEGVHKFNTDTHEDTTDTPYEAMHSKCEELEIRNYQDALHYSASSKRLKRHQVNADIQKISVSSYGWSPRRFPLSSEDCFDEVKSHLSKHSDINSPMEDAVFSSHSYKSQQ